MTCYAFFLKKYISQTKYARPSNIFKYQKILIILSPKIFLKQFSKKSLEKSKKFLCNAYCCWKNWWFYIFHLSKDLKTINLVPSLSLKSISCKFSCLFFLAVFIRRSILLLPYFEIYVHPKLACGQNFDPSAQFLEILVWDF